MDTSLGQMFFDRARAQPGRPAFKVRRGDVFTDVSYGDAATRSAALAAGFLTIPGGLDRRSSIAVLGATSMEWILVDFAALSIDVVVVPIYPSLLGTEIGYVLVDAQVQVLVVENRAQLEKARSIQGGFSFFDKSYDRSAVRVRHFVVIDPTGVEPAPDWESLAVLEQRGRGQLEATRLERERRCREIRRQDVATYAYTSGTTGPPKGVIQTHGNWLSVAEATEDLEMFTPRTRESGAFLFLPLAHTFGRLVEISAAFHTAPVIISGIDTLAADLLKTRPGLLPAAPRVYEKLYGRITAGVAASSSTRQRLFQWALSVGKATIPFRQGLRSQRRPLPLFLRLQHALADKLVFSKLRARIGLDRVETMITGAAPLAPVVHEFFVAMGAMLYEGYGLTETCGVLSTNRPSQWRLGTVGPPFRNVVLKIAADGEILAKGPNVMGSYLNRKDADADAFDAEGWFHTGDIGEIDATGMLSITDRKKDLLKTSGGKYVAPQKIEGLLKSKPLILEAVLFGDNRNYCTALLMLDEDGWKQWAQRNGKATNKIDPKDKDLLAMLQRSVDEVNRDLASFESVKYFRVLDAPLTVEAGLLTGSFKVKRKEVSARFAGLIEEMYVKKGEREAA